MSFIKGCRCIPAKELVIGAARGEVRKSQDLDARLAELSRDRAEQTISKLIWSR